MDNVLEAVTAHPAFGSKPLGIKLAPYFDMPHFQKAADILNKYPIRYVVCTNTIGTKPPHSRGPSVSFVLDAFTQVTLCLSMSKRKKR